jgi:hypothetical protein
MPRASIITATRTAIPIPAFAPVERPPEDDDDSPDPLLPDRFVLVGVGVIVDVVVAAFVPVEAGSAEGFDV